MVFSVYPISVLSFFTGCWVCLWTVILVDLLGTDNIEACVGQCCAVGAIPALIGPPLSG